ncbi:cohesin domain-containing protein [Natronospora cellulosivora (SeqCode)]
MFKKEKTYLFIIMLVLMMIFVLPGCESDKNGYTDTDTSAYTLTIEESDGGVTKPPAGTYEDREGLVELEAIADSGYAFRQWLGDGVKEARNKNTEILMDRDRVVSAEFIDDGFTIDVEKVSAKPGDTVTVAVRLLNVPDEGINSADFRVGYDSSVVEAVSVSAGGIVPRSDQYFRHYINTDREFVAYLFVDEEHERQNQIYDDGVFTYIEFRVLDNAMEGLSEISIVHIGAIADFYSNVFDADTIAGGINILEN